jgi:ATP-dependent helicase/DNAse subunit B
LKKPDYNLEEVFSQFDFPKEQSYKKEILFEIILENTEQIIEYINYFEAQSLFKKIYTEEKIDVPYNNSFRLSGYIDKIMVDEENHQYVIVDYKYSDKDFLMTDFETGIKMQLPFYLYTYKKQNPKYDGIGMLYQKTSSSKEQRDTQEDKRMKGIFIHVDDFIKRFDPSVSYIYGVKLKTDGTIKESKNNLLEPNSFNKIYDQVEEMISKTTKKILAGDFKISPIITKRSQLTKNSISCEYCQYSSICYSKNKLLGGDSL